MAYDPLLHDKLVFLSEMFSMAYDLKLAEVKFSFVGFSHRYKTASIILIMLTIAVCCWAG